MNQSQTLRRSLSLLAWLVLLAWPGSAQETPPKRQALFGDLHVHSSLSFDSYIDMNRNSPQQAYDFAKGKPVRLAEDGQVIRLRQPLDFMALTDHSEYFGEMRICTDPEAEGFMSDICQTFRDKQNPDRAFNLFAAKIGAGVSQPFPFCEQANCAGVADEVWREVQELAAANYEPGKFTTFVAYEWSASPDGGSWRSIVSGDMVHRNVIFRDQNVTPRAISTFQATTAEQLWADLARECRPPCQVMAIPHNPNYSSGFMFDPRPFLAGGPEGQKQARELARLRAEMERVVEIHQTKGQSECRWGVGNNDEACGFENLVPRPVCPGPDGNLQDPDCVPLCTTPQSGNTNCVWPQNDVRNALKEGLALGQNLGVNPFKLGFIGSTDTHNGAPGSTVEYDFQGQHADKEVRAVDRLELPSQSGGVIQRVVNNPGGLAGVWAEENTREAVFAALQRRETFATSGTRIRPRFFGGWSDTLPADACAAADPASLGYGKGVPMGGDLPATSGTAKPRFVAWAMKAPDSVPLDRLQLVKGWVEDGRVLERPVGPADLTLFENVDEQVVDVACSAGRKPNGNHQCPASGAGVDLDTCKPHGEGASDLCQVWTDEDFDPARPAFYYLRVLENPTCRWSTYDCNALIDISLEQHCSLYAGLRLPPCQPDTWPSNADIAARAKELLDGPWQDLPQTARQSILEQLAGQLFAQQLRDTAACCCSQIPRTIQERAWSSPIYYTPGGETAAK